MEKEVDQQLDSLAIKHRQDGARLASTTNETELLITNVDSLKQRLDESKREELRLFKAEQESLPKRSVAIIAGTIGVYALAQRITKRLIHGLPPEKAIWGTRALENLHAVTVIVNAIRGTLSAGRLPNFDHIWSMEIGYYIYEMSKVHGLDKLHHVISIYAYAYLLRDGYVNKDPQSARRVKLIHSILAALIHSAEPLKDFSRYLALYPSLRPISKVVWIIHHILYFVRIVEYPIVLYGRMLVTPELKGQILKGVPTKCLVVSVLFFVLNSIWMYRKLAKFSFPS